MKPISFFYIIFIGIAFQFEVTSAQQQLTSTEVTQLNEVLAKTALPTIPIFSDSPYQESKQKLYQTIMPLISSSGVSPEVAIKVINTFIADVAEASSLNTNTNITTAQLTELQTTLDAANNALTFHYEYLKRQPATKEISQFITDIKKGQAELNNKKTLTQNKLLAQLDFSKKLTVAQALPFAPLSTKINAYISLLGKIDVNILDETRQTILADISRLASLAKGTDQAKKLLDEAIRRLPERKDFFDTLKVAIEQQAAAAKITPTAQLPKPLPVPDFIIPESITPPMQIMSAPVQISAPPPAPSQRTVSQPAPVQISAPTPTPSQISAPPPAPPQRTVSQPAPVQTSAPTPTPSQKTAHPLEPIQRKSPPVKITDKQPIQKGTHGPTIKAKDSMPYQAINSSTPAKPGEKSQPSQLPIQSIEKDLASVKSTLETSLDSSNIIAAATTAINLLTKDIKPQDKEALKQLVARKISHIYNGRANKTTQETINLNKLFQAISNNKETVMLVSKKQIENVNILAKTLTAMDEKTDAQKATSFATCLEALTPNIDRYEKQLFLDGITTLFNTRKKYAQKELEQLQKIFSSLSSEGSQQKKVFDVATYQQFANWNKIVQCTLTLLAPVPQKTFKDLVLLYQSTLPSLELQDAVYERELFSNNTLPALFEHRGNIKLNDINTLHAFFDKAVNTPNLLVASQVPENTQRLQELSAAKAIATEDKTYLEALINQALTTKSVPNYSNAIKLFTKHTEDSVRKAFIIALNSLYSKRDTPPLVNKQQLLNLLGEVDKKKITPAVPFLRASQKEKIKEWTTVLKTELGLDK